MKKYGYLLFASMLLFQPILVKAVDYTSDESDKVVQIQEQLENANNKDEENVDSWMPDKALQEQIRIELNLDNVNEITKESLSEINYLTIDYVIHDEEEQKNKIESLEGLQYANNLKSLAASWNLISNLTPISELTQLTELRLRDNKITDISTLAKIIPNLEILSLAQNKIDDFSVLELGIKNITELNLSDTSFSDFNMLAGMENIYMLDLSNNNLADLSPVAEGLKKSVSNKQAAGDSSGFDLYIGGNHINDFSPLEEVRNKVNNDGNESYYGVYADYQTIETTINLKKGEPIPQFLKFYSGINLTAANFISSNDSVQVTDNLTEFDTKGLSEETTQLDLVFTTSLLSQDEYEHAEPGMFPEYDEPTLIFNPKGFDQAVGEYTEIGKGRCSGYSIRNRVTINWIEEETSKPTEEPTESTEKPLETTTDIKDGSSLIPGETKAKEDNHSNHSNTNKDDSLPQTNEASQSLLITLGLVILSSFFGIIGYKKIS
ncbi:LPXTG cell wall anchor domain-containing protein [Vagococcus coleopterorum]|uniref:LPXTG cell wall anchor domain-containing protein n=1 Tax=Vagococcus coleopterorum TaxID=2714946 RepID=A0A6G8APX2_9ENTE|nr:leucine-rich repeat domain-containing protein [Vagococcus coleopterorum]QIL47019.1 LPXTG cell wall anchor domain-containing protein [Vagococcus coleopterorum]